MGYLFLAIALLTGVTKGYCGKKTSGYVTDYKDAILTNIVRMILCIMLGLVMVFAGGNFRQLRPTPSLIVISALSGIMTSVFVVSWLVAVRKGAYMMLDVFLMLGVLVPLTAGQFLFQEQVSITQGIGIGILFVAVYIMCTYNNTIKEKMTLSSLALLVLCGTANGLTDFSQKLFVKSDSGASAAVFNCYSYIFSAVTLFVCYIVFCKKKQTEEAKEKGFHIKSILGYVFIMSVCLFANSYFKTLAAKYLDSAILYPLNQGMSLILSTIMSATLFQERVTVRCIIGIVVAFAGLLMINLL